MSLPAPVDTSAENPTPLASAQSTSAAASEADWLTTASEPGSMRLVDSVACSFRCGRIRPAHHGPRMRRPSRRA